MVCCFGIRSVANVQNLNSCKLGQRQEKRIECPKFAFDFIPDMPATLLNSMKWTYYCCSCLLNCIIINKIKYFIYLYIFISGSFACFKSHVHHPSLFNNGGCLLNTIWLKNVLNINGLPVFFAGRPKNQAIYAVSALQIRSLQIIVST